MNIIGNFKDQFAFTKYYSTFRKINTFIDKTVLHRRQRWAFASLFSAVVTYRAVELEFLAILYIAFLYLIYLIVLYFTPSGLPDPDQMLHQEITLIQNNFSLKSTQSDRPITRAITQFNLWKNICIVCVLVWICTFFEICKIPVYWPFLIIYFFWLVGLAIHRHCHHMKVYKYSLGDFNKKTGISEEQYQF